MRYQPYAELNGGPNVVVDGSATEGTVLTLSHWPHSPTPEGLAADLSAEMAMNYLGRFDLHGPAEVVSNNHFDQDGLVSIFALVDPEAALARRDFLIDLAAAGDFATYRLRDAARASMVIAAFADGARSPLGPAPDNYDAWTAQLYEEMLRRLPEICDHPERYREFWEQEDATLEASEQLVSSGRVKIEEVPALDLAIINLPPDALKAGGHRFGSQWSAGLHPMAICNATDRFALLVMRGGSYEFSYRYETWVRYQSRRPRPRVDLRPLAEELSADEPGGQWVFDGVEQINPRLYLRDLQGDGRSALSADAFRSRLQKYLSVAPPAWDPYTLPGDGDRDGR